MTTLPTHITCDTQALETAIIATLRTIYDPEIPVNIYDLGLIYKIEIDAQGAVKVDMTLTTPNCPVAQTFPGRVEGEIRAVEGVTDVNLELVWEPPWTQDNMTEAARLQMGLV